MTAGGKQLGYAGCAEPFNSHTECGAKARATGANHYHVVLVINDGISF
jgi:hypothetical protein